MTEGVHNPRESAEEVENAGGMEVLRVLAVTAAPGAAPLSNPLYKLSRCRNHPAGTQSAAPGCRMHTWGR